MLFGIKGTGCQHDGWSHAFVAMYLIICPVILQCLRLFDVLRMTILAHGFQCQDKTAVNVVMYYLSQPFLYTLEVFSKEISLMVGYLYLIFRSHYFDLI